MNGRDIAISNGDTRSTTRPNQDAAKLENSRFLQKFKSQPLSHVTPALHLPRIEYAHRNHRDRYSQ